MTDLRQKTPDYSLVVVTKDKVSSKFPEEIVSLNPRIGIHHSLNAVGRQIWDLIQEPRTVDELRDNLLVEYDADPNGVEQALLALLQKLAALGFIEVSLEVGYGVMA
ncbi:MAG: PqqD family protein [Cyanothece sp. SIO1E1]|nr:PqqD family protein [Cyanothece sp. SIO1E1]